MKIIIRKVKGARPPRTVVWHEAKLVFGGDHEQAKTAARALHEQTGHPVYNILSNDKEVRVDDTYEPRTKP